MATPQSLAEQIVTLLKEEGHYDWLPEIAAYLAQEAERAQEIRVVSAEELVGADKTDLEKELVARWGEHPFAYSVDSTLVSGYLIRFRDQVIDLSARNDLRQLAQTLKQ